MSWLHANGDRGAYAATAYATPDAPPRPPLKGRHEADLCVVGGGLTGLSAALHAAQAGQRVILLDAQRVGWGASGRNGGQVGSGFNWDQRRLAARLGRPEAHALWRAAEDAKALTRELIAAHAPDAPWRPGIVQASLTAAEHAAAADAAAHLREAHAHPLQVLDRDALAARIGTAHYAGGVLDPTAATTNPLAYALGLARAAEAAGATLHEGSEVHAIRPRGDVHQVATAQGVVTARHVVHATNGYGAHLTRHAAARLLPINNFVAATPPGAGPMPAPLAVADSRTVVNYFHQTEDGTLIYGGGESYGRRVPADIRARVRANLARVYPDLVEIPLPHAWGGTLAVTATRLPVLARPRPGLIVAGGYSGHGLALAALYGQAAAQAAGGDPARLEELARLPAPALPGGRWLGGLAANAAMAWGALRDRIAYG